MKESFYSDPSYTLEDIENFKRFENFFIQQPLEFYKFLMAENYLLPGHVIESEKSKKTYLISPELYNKNEDKNNQNNYYNSIMKFKSLCSSLENNSLGIFIIKSALNLDSYTKGINRPLENTDTSIPSVESKPTSDASYSIPTDTSIPSVKKPTVKNKVKSGIVNEKSEKFEQMKIDDDYVNTKNSVYSNQYSFEAIWKKFEEFIMQKLSAQKLIAQNFFKKNFRESKAPDENNAINFRKML